MGRPPARLKGIRRHALSESPPEVTGVFHFDNFHDRTFADFLPAEAPTREPDFISRSGSTYWDLGDSVVRLSDHWGNVSSCFWLYDGLRAPVGPRVAVARYANFARVERLTIERTRRVPVRSGSHPPLAGRSVSLVVRPGRRGPPRRRVMRIDRETPFRLLDDEGRWWPRLSHGTAWLLDDDQSIGR